MSEPVELKLYSPLQVDIIDRDNSGHAITLRAVSHEQEAEYLDQIMNAFRELQYQEDARNAFTTPDLILPEIDKEIYSCTRSVEAVNGRLYGVYSCRSSGELNPEEMDTLKRYCRDQWKQGWGEGYAHCPSESPSLGLHIHYWQDGGAPFLTREQAQAIQNTERDKTAVSEITPDTFWTLIEQAKDAYGQDQSASAYWLREQLLAMGPEQALNFHRIMDGYMKLADKYGVWNAASLIQANGYYSNHFWGFRAWLIAQGRTTYLAALKNPDSLADVPVYQNCRFEDLLYVGDMAYKRLTGRMIDNAIEPAAQQQLIAELRQDITYGTGVEYPYKWAEVTAYLPRLCAAYTTPEGRQECARRGRNWPPVDPPGIPTVRAAAPKKGKSRQNKGGDAR